jgi:acetyl-CoA synthetase/medium-chain acyl-CoA synthetase
VPPFASGHAGALARRGGPTEKSRTSERGSKGVSHTVTYRELYENFRWEVPGTFNFAADVVDVYAADRGRLALYWEDESGRGERLTFWDIAVQSRRFANVLRGAGVGRGEPVMVMLPRIPAWQVACVGALRAGALLVPCTATLRPKDIRFRATHSNARVLVTVDERLDEVESVRADCGFTTLIAVATGARHGRLPDGWMDFEDALSDAADQYVAESTRSDEPALCFYTSGTAGDPKAVLHTHAYTFSHTYTGRFWLDLRPTDLHWTTSDTGWAKAAYGVLFGPWSCGTPVFMYAGRFDPGRELGLLAKYGVSVFCAPPTEYRMLVKEDLGRYPLPRLRHCTGAGEPLNPEVINAWRAAGHPFIHDGYGQTETIILAANLPGMPVKAGSMGRPFPGHRVGVIDADGQETASGEVGDIALAGRPPSLFREYWKSAEMTRAAWRGDWYVTGDRAYRDDDGYLWFVGRADDLIISAGYRIGPFEVESALLEHVAVLESAAVATPDPVRGHVVKAFVKLRPGVEPSDQLVRELQEHVKRVTAPYKYPREIEFTDDLPKTVSGKIRRVELRQREALRKGAR